jgi:hypothetical protein
VRGRLINPFLVEIAQLDTEATQADPDGDAGPRTSGYDEDFREPVAIIDSSDTSDGATSGVVHRVERQLWLPAQIEDRQFNDLQQFFSGANRNAALECVFHFKDLESLGLIDYDTGLPTLNHNDRLCGIYDCNKKLIQTIPNPPGLFAIQVSPMSFGIGLARNLLLMSFEEREQGVRTRTSS